MSTITKGEVLNLISTPRRRLAIDCLAEHDDPVTLSDMAEWVAAEQEHCAVADLDAQQRKRAYIPLYQNHLPKLKEAGVVEMPEGRSGPISPGPAFKQVRRTMDAIDESFLPPEERESWAMRMGRSIREFVMTRRFFGGAADV